MAIMTQPLYFLELVSISNHHAEIMFATDGKLVFHIQETAWGQRIGEATAGNEYKVTSCTIHDSLFAFIVRNVRIGIEVCLKPDTC